MKIERKVEGIKKGERRNGDERRNKMFNALNVTFQFKNSSLVFKW